jgi:DNA-binding CsgD family transcriptional regulator
VIKLYEEGKTTREIAKIVKISLRDIGIILREYNKEPEPKPEKSDHAKAYQLFSIGKTPTQVSIIVDLSYETVKKWYFEYVSLNYKSAFVNILQYYPEFLPLFIEIAEKMKRGDLFNEDVNYLLANLIYCKASQHKRDWLDHEVRCLELKQMSLIEENTRLEDNKARLSHSSSSFTSLSEDP